ncbi:protein of unknown function [Clostridium cavendishii DSM 21758]|uniref:DUF4274 domain-containing protein n=1 Tax=Clostridium cavendishii DSM 21758 TaxID=1121302 RepID=A0A1M6RSU6_9CLOT|nr:DUF4274 domain-containing protein [Clostridium cavendishii]SHK35506.1 protein of unknown function [Clostridium cavendishii DSM 21758]
MDDNYQWIRELLYDDISKLEEKINKINDPIALHIIACKYNWDDGFNIPKLIIENKNCDLGTASMIFYDADGYAFLNGNNEDESANLKEWFSFLSYLYGKIFNGEFVSKSIQYTPELTKVQIYKLKKVNPSIPGILLNGVVGIKVNEVGFGCN